MPRKTMSLGDLHEIMQKYRQILEQNADTTEAYDAKGGVSTVSAERVRAAVDSLSQAIESVEGVCQDAVLAVIVETE